MNTRNETYNEFGTIDCEYEHPKFGWMPFTADPDDVDENGREVHAAIIEKGGIKPYTPHVPTAEEIQTKLQMVKEQQKERLRNEKLDAMLQAEFAEIDNAKTEQAIKQINLRG